MYTLMRQLPVRDLLAQQMPALGLAFLIASLFYRFHSFSLECLAFLATWAVLDAGLSFLRRRLAPPAGAR